eukprot:408718-Amphidinium_carterae.1
MPVAQHMPNELHTLSSVQSSWAAQSSEDAFQDSPPTYLFRPKAPKNNLLLSPDWQAGCAFGR